MSFGYFLDANKQKLKKVLYDFFFFTDTLAKQSGCAPQVLILFIDMVLLSETKALDPNCDAYMFANQRTIQMALVLVAVLCVPVLLLGTPMYLVQRNKKKRNEALVSYGHNKMS